MKKLSSWSSVNETFNGWAGSMKGREFERV
jgi:hypothetical protein